MPIRTRRAGVSRRPSAAQKLAGRLGDRPAADMHAGAERLLARLDGVAAIGEQVQRIGQEQQSRVAAGEAAEVKHVGQVRDDQRAAPSRSIERRACSTLPS